MESISQNGPIQQENRYKYFGPKLFPPEANPKLFNLSVLASLFYCKEEECQQTDNVVNTVCLPLISLCGNDTHLDTKPYTQYTIVLSIHYTLYTVHNTAQYTIHLFTSQTFDQLDMCKMVFSWILTNNFSLFVIQMA